jgi:hypothetical protein
MGSLSLWHWIIVILFAGVFAFFFAAVSCTSVRRRLFTLAEGRAYAGQPAPLVERAPDFIALLYLFSFWVLAILFGLTLARAVELLVFAHPLK